jgi:hypothetical protein
VEEDVLLKSEVLKHGATHWKKRAEMLPEKSGKQCRERWHSILSPDVNRNPLSEDEKSYLKTLYEAYGSRWSHIATLLPGRTPGMVKNFCTPKMPRNRRHAKKPQPQQPQRSQRSQRPHASRATRPTSVPAPAPAPAPHSPQTPAPAPASVPTHPSPPPPPVFESTEMDEIGSFCEVLGLGELQNVELKLNLTPPSPPTIAALPTWLNLDEASASSSCTTTPSSPGLTVRTHTTPLPAIYRASRHKTHKTSFPKMFGMFGDELSKINKIINTDLQVQVQTPVVDLTATV